MASLGNAAVRFYLLAASVSATSPLLSIETISELLDQPLLSILALLDQLEIQNELVVICQ